MRVSNSRCKNRLRGRAPNTGSNPLRATNAFASAVSESSICLSDNRLFKSAISRSTMRAISDNNRGLNSTISSTRLRNSGLKCRRKSAITASRAEARISPASVTPSSSCGDPMFDVIITTVFLKSTTWPWASVNRPSSSNWSNTWNTSGWAFSTSSNKIAEYGLRRTASVNCPPSS